MSEGIICDGCGDPIDTDREQWIEVDVSREKKGLIGRNDDTFPVDDHVLHFHGGMGKECLTGYDNDALGRKVKK